MTSKYTRKEQRDLKSYPKMPSPRGLGWKQYIEHKLKMICDSLATYARRKYVQLLLHKHIESHRESDKLAVHITHNKPTAAYMGDAIFPADSPIGIRKRKRCPGHRRLVTSLKKSGKTDVVFTPEPYTSQTCANCLRRFPKKTKSHRFKVCKGACIPHEAVNLPPKIITDRSRRRRQRERKEIARNQPVQPVETKAEISERHREQRRIARSIEYPVQLNDAKAMRRCQRRERRRKLRKRRQIASRRAAWHRKKKKKKPPIDEEEPPDEDEDEVEADAQPKPQPKPRRQIIDTGEGKLGSKRIIFKKKWHSNPGVELERAAACPVVWHRDIVAAKCILYVGKYASEQNINYFFGVFEFHFVSGRCLVYGLPIHESFYLPPERKKPSIRVKQQKAPCRNVAV